MDILFNSEGTPLLMESDSAFFDTKLDRQAADSRRRVLFPYDDTKHDFLEVLGYRVLSWGVTMSSHGTLLRLCATRRCSTQG